VALIVAGNMAPAAMMRVAVGRPFFPAGTPGRADAMDCLTQAVQDRLCRWAEAACTGASIRVAI
jgi:hypothetical protein